jgi:type I restriction enzyme M protein
MRRARSSKNNSTANLGFEAKLWLAADKLRSNEEHHAKLVVGSAVSADQSASDDDYAGADPEDPDEYKALNVFWVPPGARWTYLQNSAMQPGIGKIVDDAIVAIKDLQI